MNNSLKNISEESIKNHVYFRGEVIYGIMRTIVIHMFIIIMIVMLPLYNRDCVIL